MTSEAFESQGFEVEPAALRGAAGSIDAEADALGTLASSLEQYLLSLGACWGDDEVGRRFASGYQPAAATVLANMTALSTGLVRIAAALRAVGESYETIDQAAASTTDQLSTVGRFP